MNDMSTETDHAVLDAQHEQWQSTFVSRPEMFGVEPSYPARQTAARCEHEGRRTILELGCGQGRDALFFAGCGFQVTALDYSERGLQDLRAKAEQAGLSLRLNTVSHDIRTPLPFDEGSFDVCFSHMVYCMALTTAELKTLSDDIHRVLKPGGLNIYTARNTADSDYRSGIHRGEEMYELEGGFIVHFFTRKKVEWLAENFELVGVEQFEEGGLPKRLFLVTLRKPMNRERK